MLKIMLPAALAAALAVLPMSLRAQEYSDPAAKSGATTSKSPKSKTSAGTTSSETKTTKKKEPSKGQLEARERQKKCGAEWREAKSKGTIEKGMTWPKYWSACNKRLKDQAA